MWCKRFLPFLILILVFCHFLPIHLTAREEGHINNADQTGLPGPVKRMVYMHRQYPEPVNRALNKAQWQKLTNDKAFIYIDDTPSDAHQTLNTGATFWMNVLDFLRQGTGQILIWIGLAILVVFLLFRIFKLNGPIFFARKDKQLPGKGDMLLTNTLPDDWEQSIQDAVLEENYRCAIRYGYHYLLSLLSKETLIQLDDTKTNYQYANELSGTEWHTPFLSLTRQYEYAWYGGFPLKKKNFEDFHDSVLSLKSKLKA